MTVDIEEDDRQMILLALAWLSLDRPGFDDCLSSIAADLWGLEMYEDFKKYNQDRVFKSDRYSDKILKHMQCYVGE